MEQAQRKAYEGREDNNAVEANAVEAEERDVAWLINVLVDYMYKGYKVIMVRYP